jgi:putative membrane-bound dehydrogenase-like protein
MQILRRRAARLFSALLVAGLVAVALWRGRAAEPAKKADEVHSPLTPQQVQAAFRVAPGLRVELVAAEPEIESPVAMAFDEDGRLWVVEMRDYPNGPPPGKPPEGRVKVLEDRDGDGRFEHSTVFADGLLFANGLLPWKGGVVVTAAPHIVYLQDTDGDGKADRREVLYEGFATQNPQLRVSNPVLGLDNWVYAANGLRGGQVKRAGQPDAKPVNLGGMDFRFDLLHDRGEAVSGMGQYGNTFDDWGRRFVCDNRHHLRHVVIENRYLQRNPYLAAPAVVEDPSELDEGPLSSGGKIYPISKNWTTSNLHAGRFTAACGVFVYRGSLLPEEFRGCAYTCDPTGNLVHQEVLRQNGATFHSRPAREGVEFLATPDDWCRPVFLAHGPDGAMYVVDMYRAVIEHPEFMPPELKNRPDLTLGKDKGRIWRIVPEKHRAKAERPQLSKATTPELVALLAHPDAWWRTTAQRLLLERQDRAAVEPLQKLCASSDRPLARLHAAWMLEGLGALDADTVLRLLKDEQPRVREQAVLLSERWLAKSAPLQERVVELAGDADPQVRYQVALSLGEWDDDRILAPLAKVALAGTEDRWTRLAVASSVPKRAGALTALLARPGQGLTAKPTAGRLALLEELAAVAGGRRDAAEVATVLDTLGAVAGDDALRWQMAGLQGLAEGMGRRGTQLGEFLQQLPEGQRAAADKAAALLKQAAPVAADARHDLTERLTAIRLLGHVPWETAEPVLTRLLTDDPSQEARLAAVRALSAHAKPEVPGLLLKPWKGYTPALRREVTEAMLRGPERIGFLLGEVEAGHVKPGDLDPLRARQLVNHAQADIRDRARKLLQETVPAERKEVLQRYQAALKREGDAKKGQAVFQKNCATCHRVAGVGVDVGPDISDTRTKTAEALLTDILNPNQAVDNNYINYQVTTRGGRSVSGIIVAETASSITLKRAENQTEVVLRQDVDEIESTGLSLMPEGLEKTITVEEMADLLAFLKNWRYLDGTVPLGDKSSPGNK